MSNAAGICKYIRHMLSRRDVQIFYFGSVSVLFLKKKTWIWFRMNLVRFEKMRLGSDIVVIYYLCNS